MAIILLFLFYSILPAANNQQIEIYFNAATEKYLQGDYEKAINNLEEALKIEPENQHIKKFLLKIFVEVGTQYNIKRDYKTAFKFLEKAKKWFPEDNEINNLYNVTKDVLFSTKKDEEKKENLKEETEKIKLPEIQKSSESIVRTHKKYYLTDKTEILKPVIISTTVIIQQILPKMETGFNYIYIILIVSIILIIILIIVIVNQTIKLKEISKDFAIEKNRLKAEFELEKEKNKLEKQMQEKLQNELEKLKLKLEKNIREKYEEKITEITKDKKINVPKIKTEIQNVIIDNQKDRLKNLLLSNLTVDGYTYQPQLEEIRDRISVIAQNIYDYSAQEALKFIKTIADDKNPKVRANIIKALSKISTPETLNILFELSQDTDEYVKREVLKALKDLQKQIIDSKIKLPDEYVEKINNLIQQEIMRAEWIF